MRSRSYGSRLHTTIHQLYSLCRSENQGIFTRERDFFSQALPCLQCLRGCFTFYLTGNAYRHEICLGNWKRDDLRNAHGNFVCGLPDAERVIMGQGAVAIRTLTSADNTVTGPGNTGAYLLIAALCYIPPIQATTCRLLFLHTRVFVQLYCCEQDSYSNKQQTRSRSGLHHLSFL